MKVRLLCDRVASGGWYQPVGAIVEVDKGEAKRLIAAGSAEWVSVRTSTEIETAVNIPQGVEAAVVSYTHKTKNRRPI